MCERVDLRAVNRRALEALIQCGGFDRIQSNRKQLMQDLPLVMDWAQSRAKERAIGQGNLFDLLGSAIAGNGTSNAFESAPKSAPVADFTRAEKLRLEKELLGFYVSDHPLKTVAQATQMMAPINLSELEEQRQKASISAIVMLTDVKHVTTKNGEPMARFHIEDLTGQAEAVVFLNPTKRSVYYSNPMLA